MVNGEVSLQDDNKFTVKFSGEKIQSYRDSFCRYQVGNEVYAEVLSDDGKTQIIEL